MLRGRCQRVVPADSIRVHHRVHNSVFGTHGVWVTHGEGRPVDDPKSGYGAPDVDDRDAAVVHENLEFSFGGFGPSETKHVKHATMPGCLRVVAVHAVDGRRRRFRATQCVESHFGSRLPEGVVEHEDVLAPRRGFDQGLNFRVVNFRRSRRVGEVVGGRLRGRAAELEPARRQRRRRDEHARVRDERLGLDVDVRQGRTRPGLLVREAYIPADSLVRRGRALVLQRRHHIACAAGRRPRFPAPRRRRARRGRCAREEPTPHVVVFGKCFCPPEKRAFFRTQRALILQLSWCPGYQGT